MMKCQEKERAGRGRLLPRKHRRPRSALVPGMDDHNQHLLGVQMMTGRILTAVFGFVMSIAVAPLTMGQSLVATKGDLTFAASYGYSQRHHDGPWVLIDVGYGSDRYGSIQPRKTFHLLTPDGGRIDLPDQREYRAGLNDIRAMSAGAATMQLSPWLALPDCKSEAFVSWDGLPAGAIGRQATLVGRTFAGCRNWVMWGNSGVEWVVTVGPGSIGGAALFFRSPTGTWPAGTYTLVAEGPGKTEARLPIVLQ